MDGPKLACKAFVESESFERSKGELKQRTGLSDLEIDDRLEALVWALQRDAEKVTEQIPGRNLWVAIVERGLPPLRIYLRPRDDTSDEAEWLWIEQQP